MENASKALLIAGAILLSILIIAIGMSIYTSAQSTITDSVSSMSTQEKDAFNNQFTSYEGARTGSKVKALIGVLVANAKTYEDETSKIPTFTVADKVTVKGNNSGNGMAAKRPNSASNTNEYTTTIGAIRNLVEEKHTYWVELVYDSDSGLIGEIKLYYENDKL